MVKKNNKTSKGPRSQTQAQRQNIMNSNLPEEMRNLPEEMRGNQQEMRGNEEMRGNVAEIVTELPEGVEAPDAPPMETLAKPIFGPDANFSKQRIIKYVDAVERFKQRDPAKFLLRKIDELTNVMMHIYNLINNENYANEDEKNELSHRNSKIAEEKRQLEKQYKDLMSEKFHEFRDYYNRIYELAIETTINRETLNHVLDTYERYKKGQMSHNAATNVGIEYERVKAGLPEDFFIPLPE